MNIGNIQISRFLKISISVLWLILFIALLRRDVFISSVNIKELHTLKQAESEEYQSIFFRNDKIGFVVNRFTEGPGNDWLLTQDATMNLNVAGVVQSINLALQATLSPVNLLKSFNFQFTSPFYQMQAEGKVEGNSIAYTLQTNSSTIKDSFTFKTPPMLATSRRGYLLSENIKPGEKRKIPWFDPFSLTGKESVLEYQGLDSILINGRVQRLHRFSESFSGVRVNSWLDDIGLVVKEESPAGFVFLKEPKFKALDLPETSEDILSAVAVKTTGVIQENPGDQMQYRFTFPTDIALDLHGGRQIFQEDILTVKREILPGEVVSTTCLNSLSQLSSSPYIQSNHKDIIKIVSELTDQIASPVDKVKKLGAWVYENLDKRPVLGLPDALTTLNNKQGDCNEHAALFAALARASSIPTRVVAGVTYHKEGFYYHAWNEVCLGDQWVSIDTTTNQFPADLTHLRFIIGEMQEQMRIGGLLGKLAIEPIQKKQ